MIVLEDPDGIRTEQFYRDVLGFRMSDYIDTEFTGTAPRGVVERDRRCRRELLSCP